MSDIYKHPAEYNLEHLGDDEDIAFYVSLVRSLRPRRVMELGCGTGRITLPLAEQGAREGFEVVGLDSQPQMLESARKRLAEAALEIRRCAQFIEGDMRTYSADSRFDAIIIPCSSMSHVLELEDQIAIFKRARANLNPGGRFIVE